MQYRIQGTVRYLSLDGNRVERLLKASSGSGAGADRGTILASEKSSAYGGESSRQGADIGAEVMAIKSNDIGKYCPSSIIKKVHPGS